VKKRRASSTQQNIDSDNIYEIVHSKEMNPKAMATTFYNLDTNKLDSQSYGVFDKWKEVKGPDGKKALVLKNPEDAFGLYAKEWNAKFNVIANLLNKAKVSVDAEIGNKIIQLTNGLSSVATVLRENYKNSYLTFAATAWDEKSQEEKRKMDRLITVATLHLATIEMMLGNKDAKNFENIHQAILSLIDKITNLIIT